MKKTSKHSKEEINAASILLQERIKETINLNNKNILEHNKKSEIKLEEGLSKDAKDVLHYLRRNGYSQTVTSYISSKCANYKPFTSRQIPHQQVLHAELTLALSKPSKSLDSVIEAIAKKYIN